MPAIRSIFTFRKPRGLNPLPAAIDFFGQMGSAVFLEDRVAEVFDAQAQPRDAQLTERMNFGFGQRARLAFEGHFLGLVPADARAQPIDQRGQLLGAEERRGASAKIDKSKRPITHARQLADQLDLLGQRGHIRLDFLGSLVRVDAKVAELAAFSAERNVQVEPQRNVTRGRRRAASTSRHVIG